MAVVSSSSTAGTISHEYNGKTKHTNDNDVGHNNSDTTIDQLDREIINILIANGRDSTRTIVKKLKEKGIKISERGLGKRIARLERKKVIQGYTALVDLKKVNMLVPRLVTVKFTSPKDFVKSHVLPITY